MVKGYLSHYFDGVASKKLSEVEVNLAISNQHEFSGVNVLRDLFGTPNDKKHIPTKFLYLNDKNESISADGSLTWYDARRNNPRRTEMRLYYSGNVVSERMSPGDRLFICARKNNSVLLIVAPEGSTIENQLCWLFDVSRQTSEAFEVREKRHMGNSPLIFASRNILDELGIEIKDYAYDYLGDMIKRFGDVFPKTKDFSDYARSTLEGVSPTIDADEALVEWIDREELLFRTWEKHLISKQLEVGFISKGGDVDIDAFIRFSLSVQNRRKSRVRLALENHVEEIFNANNVKFTRSPVTEHKSKPDFLFPNIESYRNNNFDAANLTMLGVKSSCKDRWRQILDEADRIEKKHLLTLEPAISISQTYAMQAGGLQLVIPSKLQKSYYPLQQVELFSLKDFLRYVMDKQKHIK